MPSIYDRVKDTTTTTGTGTITLAGSAPTQYQSFATAGVANAEKVYYEIAGQSGGEWEVGIGTYTVSGTTLSRDTILASSNSGSAVSFSAGTKDVWINAPAASMADLLAGIYGDGNDGNVTISGNTTLARSMFYDALTVDAGVTLTTTGFRVFCKTSATINGTVSASGANGANAAGSTGASGGNAVAGAEIGTSAGSGGNGGGASVNNGVTGQNVTASTSGIGGSGGAGGIGGAGSTGTAGPAGTAGANSKAFRAIPLFHLLSAANVLFSGGGGAGGAIVHLIAPTITVGAAGVIKANGGNGGNGFNPVAGDRGAGGGGGGGGGGAIFLVYESLTNSGTIQAIAGTKGTHGTPTGTGGTGADGVDGSAGMVLKYNVRKRVYE